MPAAAKIKRISRERAGRFYETPAGEFPSVTNILGVIGKPALLNWMAAREREYVSEAAADLWEDAPANPKMTRLAFLASLKTRLSAVKAGDKLKEEAAEIGTQVHALVEWNLRKQLGQLPGPEPRITPAASLAFAEFEKWRALVNLEPVFIEQTVFSEVFGYAGSLDLAGYITVPNDRERVKAAFRCPSDLALEAFYQQHKGERVFFTGDIKTGKSVYMEARLQIAAYAQALQEMGHQRSELGVVIRLPKVETDPGFEVVPVLNLDEEHSVFLHVMELFKRVQAHDKERGWIKGAS